MKAKDHNGWVVFTQSNQKKRTYTYYYSSPDGLLSSSELIIEEGVWLLRKVPPYNHSDSRKKQLRHPNPYKEPYKPFSHNMGMPDAMRANADAIFDADERRGYDLRKKKIRRRL